MVNLMIRLRCKTFNFFKKIFKNNSQSTLSMKKYFLILIIIPTLLVCNKYIREDKLPEKIINYKIYSDEQNSSYLPFQSGCSFQIVWQKANGFAKEMLVPIHIALKDSRILTWYGSRIDLRSKQDGELLWKEEILPIADFDLKDEGFITIDNFGFYELLNLESKAEEKISLPFLSLQSRLYFSERNGKEMSYCYQVIPTPTNSPGDNFSGPEFIFSKFLPETRKFVWQFIRKEIIKTVLITIDKKRISIVTENNIYSFDSGAASDEQVKKVEASKIFGASLDQSGNLLIYLEDEEGKFELRNLDDNGAINWSYKLKNMPSLQPPASHPEGNIYIINGIILECIRNGKNIWSYTLPSKPGKAVLTIMKDASVLVSSEQLLLHISPEGVLRNQKLFDFPLTCRPVIDADENIFIATQHNIYCMK